MKNKFDKAMKLVGKGLSVQEAADKVGTSIKYIYAEKSRRKRKAASKSVKKVSFKEEILPIEEPLKEVIQDVELYDSKSGKGFYSLTKSLKGLSVEKQIQILNIINA